MDGNMSMQLKCNGALNYSDMREQALAPRVAAPATTCAGRSAAHREQQMAQPSVRIGIE